MENEMKLELDAKRTRVRLQDETQQARRRVKLVEHEHADVGLDAEYDEYVEAQYSPWVDLGDAKPPCSGIWELRPYKKDSKKFRATYDAKINGWSIPGWPFPKVSLASCEWRGLNYDPTALGTPSLG